MAARSPFRASASLLGLPRLGTSGSPDAINPSPKAQADSAEHCGGSHRARGTVRHVMAASIVLTPRELMPRRAVKAKLGLLPTTTRKS
jgi:hypothetical protein